VINLTEWETKPMPPNVREAFDILIEIARAAHDACLPLPQPEKEARRVGLERRVRLGIALKEVEP